MSTLVSKEINDQDAEFEISDIVRMSKSKKHFYKKLCFKFVWRSFCDKKRLKYFTVDICY